MLKCSSSRPAICNKLFHQWQPNSCCSTHMAWKLLLHDRSGIGTWHHYPFSNWTSIHKAIKHRRKVWLSPALYTVNVDFCCYMTYWLNFFKLTSVVASLQIQFVQIAYPQTLSNPRPEKSTGVNEFSFTFRDCSLLFPPRFWTNVWNRKPSYLIDISRMNRIQKVCL